MGVLSKSKKKPSGSISRSRTSRSARETERIAASFARGLKPGSVVALVGELGSGKTTFVRGMARGLGSRDRVKSPTFVLLHEYPGKHKLYHFDFYRIGSASELDEIGVSEVFASGGVSVVEWADRFPAVFPAQTRWVHLSSMGECTRKIAS